MIQGLIQRGGSDLAGHPLSLAYLYRILYTSIMILLFNVQVVTHPATLIIFLPGNKMKWRERVWGYDIIIMPVTL